MKYLYLKGQFKPSARIIKRDPSRGAALVSFGDGKTYTYALRDVVELSPAKTYEPPFIVQRVSDGKQFNACAVTEYSGGPYSVYSIYEVTFSNGEVRPYESSYLSITESIAGNTSNNVFEYLREIAGCNTIPIGEERDISLLDKYKRVKFIGKDSLLGTYVNPSAAQSIRLNNKHKTLIFPFGCNASQYKAVKNAFESRLSIIQGPPGTGKTQTILNIIANLLVDERTVEVASNNNSAVENVLEKLQKYELDFLAAQLGKADNKKAFLEGQTGDYPEIETWGMNPPELKELGYKIGSLSPAMLEYYADKEKLAIERQALREAEIQYDIFKEKSILNIEIPAKTKSRLKDETIIKSLSERFELENLRNGKLSLPSRIRMWWYHLPKEGYEEWLQHLYFQVLIANTQKRINELEICLDGFEEKERNLELWSMDYLKAVLHNRYSGKSKRPLFARSDIEGKGAQAFLKEYPIVLSTTFSATTNINQDTKFDYLIIDEASQVDVSAGALALNCANNAVVVGDMKQLPNVVNEITKRKAEYIASSYRLHPAYKYTANSFLSSVCALPLPIPQVLLKEHYRCHPLIIGFCNKMFYGGDLIPMTTSHAEDQPLVLLSTVKGNQARGTFNLRQAQEISQTVIPSMNYEDKEIGVIAPYNEQVNVIKKELRFSHGDIPVATVHKFQGQEKDAIILSTVDNEIREFVDDPHLLNVAVSRAKNKFVLVISGNELPDSNIKNLVEYISYYGGTKIQGKLSSVFDLLYEVNSPARAAFIAEHSRISGYDTENLVCGLLEDILKEERFNRLSVAFEHPLRYLIGDTSVLTEEEKLYASRRGTHIDFLVFSKVTKAPVLAIEADGFMYHKEGTEQNLRDQLKNSILEKIGLPLLRLSTLGSGEYDAIRKAINTRLETMWDATSRALVGAAKNTRTEMPVPTLYHGTDAKILHNGTITQQKW